MKKENQYRDFDIAIIGIAGRFPCAKSVDEFWENITQGKDCITRNIETDIKSLDYINSFGILDNIEYFDASFFGISDAEAEMLDPQQRLLLTLTYTALEDAGCKIEDDNRIGLFAGAEEFKHVWERIFNSDKFDEIDYYTRRFYLGGSLTSRVSYKLNLKGPSVTSKAACATSLVTTHMACQSLLNYECDIALSGGVSIYDNQTGYYKVEGTISNDGYTRCFDEEASGFVPGNGAGILVLKRLSDSLRDHDNIYAIIRGSAMNNDGNQKVAYSAPSLLGEVNVIKAAQNMAEVLPSDISYIETHGTATSLGDALEIEALKKVFSTDNIIKNKQRMCAIGSVKSNVGHLNIAAGVAGLIKTAFMLHEKKLTPSINFTNPNSKLGLNDSPFFVNTDFGDWKSEGKPRIAGVSAFGIGGTNCHVIMEEPPQFLKKHVENSNDNNVLVLSAKSKLALKQIAKNLSEFIKTHTDVDLSDIAYTLQKGRNSYNYRIFETCSSKTEAIEKLSNFKNYRFNENNLNPNIVFMFPGTSQIDINEINRLCISNKVFNDAITECFNYIKKYTDIDVLKYYMSENKDQMTESLITMSLTFSVDYALTLLWMSIGIKPDYVIGYSLGEYVAACISGAITLEDVLYIIIERCRLFGKIDDGEMLTISATEEQIKPLLIDGIEISAYNADNRLMVSGLTKDIVEFINVLEENSITYVSFSLGKPSHCKAVEKILPELRRCFDNINFKEPQTSIISTCTGSKLTYEQLKDKEHWISHTRNAVQFHNAVNNFRDNKNIIFLEVGFGEQLQKLVKKSISKKNNQYALNTIDGKDDVWKSFLSSVGEIWTLGAEVDWDKIYSRRPYKITLPTYPFEEKYYYKSNIPTTYTQNQEECKIIVDGLSDSRYELTKYFASKNKTKVIVIQEENNREDNTFSISTTVEEQLNHIKNIEKDIIKLSNIRCIWEYDGLAEVYDNLCLSCASEYFRSYDLFTTENSELLLSEIRNKVKLVDDYEYLMKFLLLILQYKGYISINDDKVKVLKSIKNIADPYTVVEQNKITYGEFVPYMNLLLECSTNYSRILSGEILGKEILYPNGEYKMLESVINQIPSTTKVGEYCDVLVGILKHLASFQKKKIRILEFGAGTGLLTWKLAERLKDHDIEYCFTDIGRSFLTAAQKEAEKRNYDFMTFAKLDISKPFDEQGIAHGEFDFAIGLNVIQATDNIENSLVNVKKVLRKSGVLCLLQTIKAHNIQEMIFGLCPEWWNYKKDTMREVSPVLTPNIWNNMLKNHDFSRVDILPYNTSGKLSDIALILAKYDVDELSERENINNKISSRFNELKEINKNIEIKYVDDYNSKATKELLSIVRQKNKGSEILLPSVNSKILDDDTDSKQIYRNSNDEKLLKIIFDVVGIEVEDIDQSIFELDVDSLSGLIISTRVRNTFNIPFTIKDLLSVESIREISDMITNILNTSTGQYVEDLLENTESTKNLADLIKELDD